MAESPASAPVGVDPSRASVARVYDVLLGGKDNYEIDREVAEQLRHGMPEVARIAIDNRAWLGRVVRYLATTVGITQFLDCGAGLPTAENTHQIAQRANRDASVIYVDHDPVVVAHSQALLEDQERTFVVSADLSRPEDILTSKVAETAFDWSQPVALLQVATLHHLPATQDPQAAMRTYIDALPSGSYVALSHLLDPADGSALEQSAHHLSQTALQSAMNSGQLRTAENIRALFAECTLIEPGLTPLAQWWPDGPLTRPLSDTQRLIVGGVAYKP